MQCESTAPKINDASHNNASSIVLLLSSDEEKENDDSRVNCNEPSVPLLLSIDDDDEEKESSRVNNERQQTQRSLSRNSKADSSRSSAFVSARSSSFKTDQDQSTAGRTVRSRISEEPDEDGQSDGSTFESHPVSFRKRTGLPEASTTTREKSNVSAAGPSFVSISSDESATPDKGGRGRRYAERFPISEGVSPRYARRSDAAGFPRTGKSFETTAAAGKWDVSYTSLKPYGCF